MVDWIACILELSGAWLVGNKNKYGFLLLIVGSVFWFIAGASSELFGLMLVSIFFALINIRNYIKWCKNGSRDKSISKGNT